jgi:hypothetical protein
VRAQRIGVAMAVGLVVLAIPASAGAAVTLGSALQTEPDGNLSCATGVNDRGCLAVNDVLPGGQLVAPFDGVIVGWRLRVGPATQAQTVRIRVVRRVGADTFTAISSGALESVPDGAGTYAFPARLSIRSGEEVGIENGGGPNLVARAPLPGARILLYNPSPADGANSGPPAITLNDQEQTFNVNVEPDCDGDGFGDETQDPQLPLNEACGKGTRTLTLDANKSKVKKGKKVALSGRVTQTGQGGTACSANQAVQLQRKKPSQTAFTTVEQLQTDAAGSFSAKEKVKKTFEYRAVLAETATCDDTLSDTEKVKVKKKK